MDLQIKNQQMKDKDICENSELTAELKLFLEQPNRDRNSITHRGAKARKDRSELGSTMEAERKVIISINMERYPLFWKMLSRIKSVKNLRAKTTLLQEADPRMFHGGSAHPGTATPRCWMLRLKEVLSEQVSHWSRIVCVNHFGGLTGNRHHRDKQIDSKVLNFNRKVRI